VNYKGEQVHTHTLTVEEGAAGSGFFSWLNIVEKNI
jgi:hypothetical protein